MGLGWGQVYTTEQWLDTVPTFGGYSQIPPGKLTELLGGIGPLIDEAGGTFTMGYNTLVVTPTRLEADLRRRGAKATGRHSESSGQGHARLRYQWGAR